MIKNNNHILLRHKAACERVVNKIDDNPNALKNLCISPREAIVNDNNRVRDIGIAGLLISLFVKVFH
jgi:hypothetical protein